MDAEDGQSFSNGSHISAQDGDSPSIHFGLSSLGNSLGVMSTAGSIAPEQAEPSTSDIQKIFSPAKIKKLVKKRNELIRKQEEYATREVDFDNPDREERKDKEEKDIHKMLLKIEKLLYEQGELVDVTEDTHRLFGKNRQKYQLVIKGTGNELLDQQLSEALKTKLEDEPSYVMSCALDPAKMMDICLKVKKQELDATGKSSIPNKSTGPFDLLMAKVAGLVKKAVVDYRYGDHNSLLNVYVTKEEEAKLNEVEELHEPMGMPKDLTQIVCEGEDNAHDDIKNAGGISTASGSDSGDATDYDEVYEGEDEDSSGENMENDDVMDILETTSESRDNGIEKESKTMVTNECSPVNDIPPPEPLGSEDSSSIEVLPNVVKNGSDYSEIVLSSGPTRHSASDMDAISIRMAPIKKLSIKSSAAVVIHNGLNKDSLQSADEKGDFIEESDDEEEQPIKPEWLKGKTSEELVACFNAHIENEDLQVIYATEYEEFEPRIEKFKMERCADWAAQIEGWLVEFPDLAEVEKPSLPEIEAEVKKSTPSPTTGPRNGKRERTRSRQRSERLRAKEVEEAAKEVKRMRPAEFSPTLEIITID